jgi:hypothetical protein
VSNLLGYKKGGSTKNFYSDITTGMLAIKINKMRREDSYIKVKELKDAVVSLHSQIAT